jgi:hypothetical protein
MFEVAPDILSELLDGSVAALRFFAESHEDDVVEVAAQPLAELFRRAFTPIAEGAVVHSLWFAIVCRYLLSPHRDAGLLGFGFADGTGNLKRCVRWDIIRSAAGEKFV